MAKTKAFICFLLPLCLQGQQINFSIQIAFHLQVPAKKIFVAQATERKIDTLMYPANDTLRYTGKLSQAGIMQLLVDSYGNFQFWVDATPISCDLVEDSSIGKSIRLKIINLVGSVDTRLLNDLVKESQSEDIKYPVAFTKAITDSLNRIIVKNPNIKIDSLLKSDFLSWRNSITGRVTDSLAKARAQMPYRLIDSLFKYYFNSPIVPLYISFYSPVLLPDSIRTYYDRLPGKTQESMAGEDVRKLIQRNGVFKKGTRIDDFSMMSSTGNNVSLYSVAGKYILLDFWASWCGPCRASNPHLAELYSRYREKGLEIVGISLDESKSDWRAAIKKDKMTWYQLSDLKGRQGELIKKFYIGGIPFMVLLDSGHRVVLTSGNSYAFDLLMGELLK